LEEFEESGLFARRCDQTKTPTVVGEQDARGSGVQESAGFRGAHCP